MITSLRFTFVVLLFVIGLVILTHKAVYSQNKSSDD